MKGNVNAIKINGSFGQLVRGQGAAGGSPAQSIAYNYDLAGNRTSVVEATSSSLTTNAYTPGTGNHLASWGANGSALYDAAGNTTNLVFNDGTELDLGWDSRYRLDSVETSGKKEKGSANET